MLVWYNQYKKGSGKSNREYNGYGIAFNGKGMWSFGNDFATNANFQRNRSNTSRNIKAG